MRAGAAEMRAGATTTTVRDSPVGPCERQRTIILRGPGGFSRQPAAMLGRPAGPGFVFATGNPPPACPAEGDRWFAREAAAVTARFPVSFRPKRGSGGRGGTSWR
jgi:hypothetical protein